MKHLQKFYKKGITFLIIILIGFLSGALGSFVTLQLSQKQGSQVANSNSTVTQTSYSNETATTKAVNKVKDAVVSVITYSANRQNSVFGNDETDTDTDSQQVASEGSGVIYKKNGKDAYLVTNTHVIKGA